MLFPRYFALIGLLYTYLLLENAHCYHIVVVGGGAAGYFSAIACAETLQKLGEEKLHTITLLEATNQPLGKVLISGGGRCNVMHDPHKGANAIAKGYPRGQRELLGPLNKLFGPWDTFSWFEQQGVALKVEGDGRVFPLSDQASDVVGALERAAKRGRVNIRTGCRVAGVRHSEEEGGKFILQCRTRSRNNNQNSPSGPSGPSSIPRDNNANNIEGEENSEEVQCDRLVLATGSSRQGYEMARGLGHTVLPPAPALFSFLINDEELTALSGLSNPFTRVRLVPPPELNLRPLSGSLPLPLFISSLTQRGGVLVTQTGLSGPPVLRLSSFAARLLEREGYRGALEVSWVGDLPLSLLEEALRGEKRRHPQRRVGRGSPLFHVGEMGGQYEGEYKYSVGARVGARKGREGEREGEEGGERDWEGEGEGGSGAGGEFYSLPRRLWLYLLRRAGINEEVRWGELSLSSLSALCLSLQRLSLRVEGRGRYRDEFVTCGGVALGEVRMASMSSRKTGGLFFGGELLDIDGVTGGYNFQAAWTSGYLAGRSAALSCALGAQAGMGEGEEGGEGGEGGEESVAGEGRKKKKKRKGERKEESVEENVEQSKE